MNTNSIDAAVDAWHGAIDMLIGLTPGGMARRGSLGTHLIATGIPFSFLNGVACAKREPDIQEVIAFARAFGSSHESSSVPWGIQLRAGHADPQITETVATLGVTPSFTYPFMMKALTGADTVLQPAGKLRIRHAGPEDHEIYNGLLATSFDVPAHFFRRLTAPAVLGGEGMTAYIAEYEQIPVATAFAVKVGDQTGVFNVSTLPAFRRGGFAKAAMAALLRDAYAGGARTAFLHSSSLGQPLYRSLGFETVENWLVLVKPAKSP